MLSQFPFERVDGRGSSSVGCVVGGGGGHGGGEATSLASESLNVQV